MKFNKEVNTMDRKEHLQTLPKNQESEFSADNTMQICHFDEEIIEPQPRMEGDENAIQEPNNKNPHGQKICRQNY